MTAVSQYRVPVVQSGFFLVTALLALSNSKEPCQPRGCGRLKPLWRAALLKVSQILSMV